MMLDNAGKMLEHIIVLQTEARITMKGGLSKSQYGF